MAVFSRVTKVIEYSIDLNDISHFHVQMAVLVCHIAELEDVDTKLLQLLDQSILVLLKAFGVRARQMVRCLVHLHLKVEITGVLIIVISLLIFIDRIFEIVFIDGHEVPHAHRSLALAHWIVVLVIHFVGILFHW